MNGFSSFLAERFSGYVALQRALGYQFDQQRAVLHKFDSYLMEGEHIPPITQDMAISFATEDPSSSLDKSARRYHEVRRFFEYLSTFDPQTPTLDPKAVPRPSTRPTPPIIISDDELALLLHQARHISESNPQRGVTLHAMVGLVASTGLRISEVVGLDRADVDLKSGVLHIRQTKFRKDRYVPTHPTTVQALCSYAAARDAAYLESRDPAFFISMWRRRFCCNTLQQQFCKAARRAGLRGPTGRGLSFHHLRHRFAVKRLLAWYRAGADVQAMLPVLATYMGHVHYTDTAYYLTSTAELLSLAADRRNRWLEAKENPL
jgi:integrase